MIEKMINPLMRMKNLIVLLDLVSPRTFYWYIKNLAQPENTYQR